MEQAGPAASAQIVFGIAAGLVLDVPLRRILPKGLYGGYEGHADEVDCHEEHEEHSSIFLAALRHTLEILCSSWCSALSLG